MEKVFDVTALGELLIDFTENGISSQGNPLLEANPGGAPCNVLAMLCKLGRRTSFIGKVGNDNFGRMLKETIEGVGIDSGNLILDIQPWPLFTSCPTEIVIFLFTGIRELI